VNKYEEPTAETVGRDIKRGLKWLTYATVFLYLALGGGAAYVYLQSLQNHNALCAFRNDLRDRADKTQRILDNHPKQKVIDLDPDPVSALNVSRTTLQTSVEAQKHVVVVFDQSGINCK
jgi:hypothetical protein